MVDDSIPDQLQCTNCLLPMQYQEKKDGKFLWQCFKCGKKYFISVDEIVDSSTIVEPATKNYLQSEINKLNNKKF